MIRELPGGLPPYGTFVCLAGLLGLWVAFRCGRADGIDGRRLAVAQLLMALVGFAGAKIYGAVVVDGGGGWLGGWSLNGFRYPGGVAALAVFGPVVAWVVSIPLGRLLDIGTPAFGIALATVRIGCLLAGCCAGSLCDFPWGIRYPQRSSPWVAQLRDGWIGADAAWSLPMHPLPVYFGLYSLGLGLLMWWLLPRRKFDGQVFCTYVTLESAGKFLLEFLRYRPSPEVQYPSLFIAIVAAAGLLLAWRRHRPAAARVPQLGPNASDSIAH